MTTPTRSQWLTVPNLFTTARFVLSIVVFVLIEWRMFLPAMVVFIVAASTDWIDGYWARRFQQTSKVGRIYDPFVDKIIICGSYIFLVAEPQSGLTAWMAVVVAGRELLVTALRSAIEGAGGDFSARWAAKWKMLFQCVAVGASLLVLSYGDQVVPTWASSTLLVSAWLAIVTTVFSGVQYVVLAARTILHPS
jgi:CDP-diacylglycerol---glycerol-3-phosphate 3-phosphatidyltransferase